jgi:uncharacterized protein
MDCKCRPKELSRYSARVELAFHRDAAAFRQRAGALLSGRDSENQLLLGILHATRSGDGTRLCTLEEGGRALAVAVQVPQRQLVLARAEPRPLQELAREWHRQGLPLTAVFGPTEVASIFAAAWPGARLELALSMRGYELTQLSAPRLVPGALRLASNADAPLLTAWVTAFIAETGGHPGDPAQVVPDGVREQRLFVWETAWEASTQAPPVAMAAWTGRTPTSARVSLVYTPPELRGRGYASACVAAVSQRLLDEGLERCFLFTDLANPTSNAIYQRLGYRPVADFAEYRVA